MTAAKEEGAFIEIDGKKVALGIPGRKPPSAADASASAKAYPDIPLARPGTADEAAAGVLLCVSICPLHPDYESHRRVQFGIPSGFICLWAHSGSNGWTLSNSYFGSYLVYITRKMHTRVHSL